VYEVYIEPSTEFYRREEKYVTNVYRVADASITGLFADSIPGKPDQRTVIISTPTKLLYFSGHVGRHAKDGVYTELFQRNTPTVHDGSKAAKPAPSSLAISPQPVDDHHVEGQSSELRFAWLSAQGVLHGVLDHALSDTRKPIENAKLIPRTVFPASESSRGGKKLIQDPVTAINLSQWHVLALVEGRVVAVNVLSGEVVHDQPVLEPGQSVLGLLSDRVKNTYWLFTSQEIYEIVAYDEDRDVWRYFLQEQKFDKALRYAQSAAQKDAIATASGDYLAAKGKYQEASMVWGKSSKSFEEVCLTFINAGEHDALRKYLLTKLASYKKSAVMQRVMITSWLVEVFMAKLNSLDDTIATKAELTEGTSPGESKAQLDSIRAEFEDFVTRFQSDLDQKTVYDIISSHGREAELLFFANATNDYNYVLSYWVQREKWSDALNMLQKQTDPEVFYKYSTVLMVHDAIGLVDIMIRQTHLDPERLIPALLSYNHTVEPALNQNQAIRYLNFIIANHPNPAAAVHNTLISIYASSSSTKETALLNYLESQPSDSPPYDADFALRLCIQYERVQSCIYIYSSMGQYQQAVELALKYNDIEFAAIVADRPEGNDKLRKKLWLLVAEKKIRQPGTGIKDAIEFLRRCELLRIEDMIPFFPDFVVIDDFKDEICKALEEYSIHIDELRQEMDTSAQTASQIRGEIADLDSRYAIVEPGEKCWICSLPLLSRQFFVFPCQHAFHSDCLGKEVLEGAGGKKRYIRDLQAQISKGNLPAAKREKIIIELDSLIAEAW
jgi:vacuolar protein sorting-associated protein 18